MRVELVGLELAGRHVGIHTYGALIAIGFLLGCWVAARGARRNGATADGEPILDLCFWILVGSLLGARVLYLATTPTSYLGRCQQAFAAGRAGTIFGECTAALQVWEGGLVFYGGLAGGAAAVAWFVARRGLPFLPVADCLALAMPIGHFFGRIGCFAAGCCFGRVAPAGLGVRFPAGSVAHDLGREAGLLADTDALTPPLHATQLYEAAGLALLAGVLIWVRRRQRRHGTVLLAYLAGYALVRTGVEVFRGDLARRYLIEVDTPALDRALGLSDTVPSFLSTSQAISLVAAAGALGLGVLLRKPREVDAPGPCS